MKSDFLRKTHTHTHSKQRQYDKDALDVKANTAEQHNFSDLLEIFTIHSTQNLSLCTRTANENNKMMRFSSNQRNFGEGAFDIPKSHAIEENAELYTHTRAHTHRHSYSLTVHSGTTFSMQICFTAYNHSKYCIV